MASFSVDPSLVGWADKIAQDQRYNVASGTNAGQQIFGSALAQNYRPVTDAQWAAYEQANPNVVAPASVINGQRYLPVSFFGDQGSGAPRPLTGGTPQTGSAGSTGGSGAAGAAVAGGAPTASAYPNFAPPDPNNPTTDPTLAFRLSQGTQAIQNSAAARGTLLTGGTEKALNDYAQNEAATGYQQAYNNALQTYGTNRDTAQNTFGNGLATFNANLSARGQAQQFSLAQNAQAEAAREFAQRLALEKDQQALSAQEFGQQLAQQQAAQAREAQAQSFNQQYETGQATYDRARQAWLDAGGIGPLYGSGYMQPGAPYNYASASRQAAYQPYTFGASGLASPRYGAPGYSSSYTPGGYTLGHY